MKRVRGKFCGVKSVCSSDSTRSRQLRLLSLAACLAGASMAKSALAATETWTGLNDVTWTGANWAPTGYVPASGDTAVFNNPGNAMTAIDLGLGVTIGNILFDYSNAAAYTIGAGGVDNQTLTLNNGGTITINPSVTNNQTFNSAIILGTDQTAQTYTVTNNSPDTLTFAGNITGGTGTGAVGVKTFTVGGAGNTTISGNLLYGAAAGDLALTKNGAGNVTLSGTSTFTGATTINGGTLELDFTPVTAPTSNIIATGSALHMNGGTLLINGNATNANTQTFASTTFTTGQSFLTAVNNGTSPTVNLGAITYTGFAPVQYSTSGTFTTSTPGGGPKGLMWVNYATYGSSDWAATNGTTITGLSSITGGYVTTMGTTGQGQNMDLQANYTAGGNVGTTTIRFNTPTANTVSVNGKWIVANAILVTPNMGAVNSYMGNGNWYAVYNTAVATEWVTQNNPSGYLVIGSLINDKGGAGALAYVQSGPGTVQMPWTSTISGAAVNSANQYTGQDYLNGGATLIKVDADLGSPAAGATVNLDGGSVVGDANITLDNAGANKRAITVGTNGGGLAAANGFNMIVDGVISGAGTLTVGIPASSANNNTAGLLPGSGTGTANTTPVNGTGTVTLSSVGNSFSGGAIITGGSILNINSQFALGGANYTGLTFSSTGGTLQYATTLLNTTTDMTQNSATIPAAQPVLLAGPATIDTNGHAITYANSFGAGGSGSLTIRSTAPGGVLTLNNTTFTGGVTVNSGGLTLNGTNIYIGATTVSGGTLTVNATATLGNTAITVASGATAAFKPGAGNLAIGTTGASLNLSTGSIFSMADGSVGTLTLNAVGAGTGTVLTLPAGNASMTLDISSNGTLSADQIIANNGAVSAPGGTENITLNPYGTTAPTNLTNIPLITVPNGGSLTSENFNLSTPSVTFGSSSYTTSLSVTGNVVYLDLTAAKLTYYWKGATSGSWQTIGNFTADAAGTTPQIGSLGVSSNVIETANSPAGNYAQTLDGNVAIDSLEFTGTGTGAAGNAVIIAPGAGTPSATLILNPTASLTDPTSGINYPVGTGLIVQSGSAAHTISANVALGMSQTWEIDNSSANAITISGNISDGASGYGITKTGVGGLILSGSSNTYSGLTTVTNGVLTAASNSALGSTTGSTAGLLLNPAASTTATVNFTSAAPAIASLASSGAGTSNIVLGNATAPSATTLTIGGNNASTTFTGTISDLSATNPAAIGSVTKIGSGTLALTGVNTYTGQTNISGGVVQINSASSLGNASAGTNSIVLNAATLDSSNGTYSLGVNRTIAVTGTGTLEVDSGAMTVNGAISDGTPPATVTKTGAGTLVLAGSNTYTGPTNLNGGVTQISASANLGNASAGTNTISINNATLELTANQVDLGLNRSIALPGLATIQTDTGASLMVDGSITGAGTLTTAGAGVLIFNGSNSYTGVTTITNGTLQIGNGGTTGTLGTNSVTDNALLAFNLSNSVTVTNTIGGTGNLQQAGAGTLTISTANNTFTGHVNVSNGTLVANAGNGTGGQARPSSLGETDIANRSINVTNAVLVFGASNVLGAGSSFAAANYAAVSLTNSTFNLTPANGNNTVGAITLNGSTINLQNTGNSATYESLGLAGSVTVTGNASFINSNASGNNQGINLGIGNPVAAGYQTPFNVSSTTGGTASGGTLPDLTIAATLDNGNNNGASVNTGLIKTGGGTLALTAANSYAGATTISAGSLALGNGGTSGSLNTSGAIVDNANFTINRSDTPTQGNDFSGLPITGTGSFTQAGTGTTIFTAANTYAGPTAIGSGSLQLGNGGNTGSLATTSTITNNGNLTINRGNNVSQGTDFSASPITGTGSLTQAGSGITTLSSTNTYSGGTSVTSGTLDVTNTTGSATGPGVVNLSNGSITGSGSIAGTVIQTSGTIGPGSGATLSIGGLNFSGGSLAFTLNGLTQASSQISTSSAIFSSVPTISISAVNSSGLANGQVYTLLTSTSPITDMGNLTSLASTTIGRVTIVPSESGTNSIIAKVYGTPASLVWAGGVTGLGGTITGDGSTWDNTQTAGQSGNWNKSGQYDYFYDIDNVLFNEAGAPNHNVNVTTTISPGSVTVNAINPYTFAGSGSIAGAGTLAVQAGTLNLNNSNGNSYTGGTIISAGATLATGATNVMPATGLLTVAGTFDLAGNSQTIGTLSDGGVTTGVITNSGSSGATLTTGLSVNSTFNGTIQDGVSQVSLTKLGTGTLTLSGSNTYSGSTSINGGVLQIGASPNLGNASSSNGINIGPSATLESTGTSVDLGSSRNVNLNGSSTFQVDGTGTLIVDGTINGSGPLIKTGTGTLVLSNSNNYNGATDLNAGVLSLQNGNGLGYSTPVIVAAGAELQLSGGSISVGNTSLLTLNGSGVSGGGALHSVAGSNSYAAAVTLGTASTINSDTGSSLALSGAVSGTFGLTFGGGGTITESGNIGTGASSVTYNGTGSGSLTLFGQNSFTGNVIMTGGTLIANAGNGTGTTPRPAGLGESDTANRSITVTSGTLNFNASNVLGAGSSYPAANYPAILLTNSNFTITAMDGAANTDGNNTVGAVTLNGSTISLQAPGNSAIYQTLGLAGSVTVTGAASNITSTGSAGFQGINLGIASAVAVGYQTNFNVTSTTGGTASGGTSPDLTVGAALVNGNNNAASISTGLLKTGAGEMSMTGSNTYSGLTTISAGTLVFASATAFPSTATSGLNVSSGAVAVIANHASNLTYVPQMSALNNSGTVDITNNAIVVHNGSIGTIISQVNSAYNSGAWNGTSLTGGVITSSTAAGDVKHLTALGVGTGITGTFEGLTVVPTDVLVKYTWYGDANLDGTVDGSDYSRIDNGALLGLTGWYNGDFNYDGVINGSDYTLIDNAFNQQGAQFTTQIAAPTAQIAGASAAVPEPEILGVLGIGAFGLLGRRTRRWSR